MYLDGDNLHLESDEVNIHTRTYNIPYTSHPQHSTRTKTRERSTSNYVGYDSGGGGGGRGAPVYTYVIRCCRCGVAVGMCWMESIVFSHTCERQICEYTIYIVKSATKLEYKLRVVRLPRKKSVSVSEDVPPCVIGVI